MVRISSITNHIYTPFGTRYDSYYWDDTWLFLLGMEKKERQQIRPFDCCKDIFHDNIYSMQYLLYFFDQNVLQSLTVKDINTTMIRLRIAQSIVDKTYILKDYKDLCIKAKNAFVDTCIKMSKDMWDKHLSRELPF